MPALSENDVFSLALFLALMLHSVILAITFDFEDPASIRDAPDLEITLIRHPTPAEKPDKADFLAQLSQQGGGTEKEKVLPKTPLAPPTPVPEPMPSREQQDAGSPEQAKPQEPVLQTNRTETSVAIRKRTEPTPRKSSKVANLLASRDREIQRLTADLDLQLTDLAHQPRRKTISASTQEYRFAAYMDAWKKKVERVGTLNFPDEAKRKKLYGNLVLLVSLNPNGTINRIELRKSSGHKVLDDAAIRIVRLAAPFAPFPKNIAEELDILDIVRTWQFVSGKPLFRNN